MGSVTLQDVAIEQAIHHNDTGLVLDEVQRFCMSTLTFMTVEHEEKTMDRRLANYENVCVKAEMVLAMLRKYNQKLDQEERRSDKLSLAHTRKPLALTSRR
jgi:hypothetical protein